MNNPLTVIAPIVALGFAYVAVPVALDAYRRLRGPRSVTCPETGKTEDVEVDTGHAALTSIVGKPSIDIRRCSRWLSDRHYCDQECRGQLG